ncbi:hypothetical protein ACVB8G_006883, partial [Pseudomonas aeruginosa]
RPFSGSVLLVIQQWSCSLWITFEQVSQKKCGQLSLMPLDCQAGVSFPHFGFGHFILPIHGAFAS